MKRLRLIVMVVTVMVMGVVAIACFRAREPRYQGRTLSEWIEGDLKDRSSVPERQAAERAVKQIGSNAIPWLLKWADKRDSSLKQRAIDFLDEHPAILLHLKSSLEYNSMALRGFELLGSEAKPAWPILIQWTFSPDVNRQSLALNLLEASKADKAIFLPVLLRVFHDSRGGVQIEAAFLLHDYYPEDAEAAGVYKIFPKWKFFETNQSTTNQPPAK